MFGWLVGHAEIGFKKIGSGRSRVGLGQGGVEHGWIMEEKSWVGLGRGRAGLGQGEVE